MIRVTVEVTYPTNEGPYMITSPNVVWSENSGHPGQSWSYGPTGQNLAFPVPNMASEASDPAEAAVRYLARVLSFVAWLSAMP